MGRDGTGIGLDRLYAAAPDLGRVGEQRRQGAQGFDDPLVDVALELVGGTGLLSRRVMARRQVIITSEPPAKLPNADHLPQYVVVVL